MKMFFATLVISGSVALICAEPPKYPDWPTLPSVPDKMPDKPVRVDPGPVSSLLKDQLYVVQSDSAVQLLASPPGVVVVTEEVGPIRIRGEFVDGKGQVETRLYEKKQVFLIERVAQGAVELLMVPKGEVVRRVITDDQNPIPPPKPVEPKPDEPKPVVEKSPWDNAPGMRVLIVYPRRGALPALQQSIVTGKRVREYLDTKTAQEPEGKAYWILKTDEDVTGLTPSWQKAYGTLKGDRWVVIGNGAKWTAEVLPADPDKMLELLRKYE